ncbi:MAG: hypothetical protein ACRCU5_15165 [Rhizobiaceae bacterium]
MQHVRSADVSWMPAGADDHQFVTGTRPELGPCLFQLVVGEIDNRSTSKPADVIGTLAFLAGRIVQRSLIRERPESFRLDQSANGISFLRSDLVTAKLCDSRTGSLASKLVQSALLTGAGRFPDFRSAKVNAQEAMLRRAAFHAPNGFLSDAPEALAANIQADVDSIVLDPDDRGMLIAGVFDACGLAISYARHRLEPSLAAELALGIALFGGWLDQRKIGGR